MDVYRDGIWAEFTIANINSRRKYVAPMFMALPVTGASVWDMGNRTWSIPQPIGTIQYNNPDTFIGIESGSMIRYRSRISGLSKPLVPGRAAASGPKVNPDQLNYGVVGWSVAYTKLTDTRSERESVFVFGAGAFPVRWFDEDCPKSLSGPTRLPRD
jgi:hypothetical protein